MKPRSLALLALGSGVAGWAIENAASPTPRYSAAFGGAHVPLLPVYAAGGATVGLIEPLLEGQPILVRAAVYGLALTGVEAAAGAVDHASGHQSWDYAGQTVDVRHTLLWAGLGLALEQVARRMT